VFEGSSFILVAIVTKTDIPFTELSRSSKRNSVSKLRSTLTTKRRNVLSTLWTSPKAAWTFRT